jgi:hypothetical protein
MDRQHYAALIRDQSICATNDLAGITAAHHRHGRPVHLRGFHLHGVGHSYRRQHVRPVPRHGFGVIPDPTAQIERRPLPAIVAALPRRKRMHRSGGAKVVREEQTRRVQMTLSRTLALK